MEDVLRQGHTEVVVSSFVPETHWLPATPTLGNQTNNNYYVCNIFGHSSIFFIVFVYFSRAHLIGDGLQVILTSVVRVEDKESERESM